MSRGQLRNDSASIAAKDLASSVYSRAVRKAAELLGGRDALARQLQVGRADIDKWIADQAKPPREVFLRVVDVIIDDNGPASEPAEPSAPKDAACAEAWRD